MVYYECFEMNGREQDILQVFYYFDYFRHPLTAHEVWKYCHEKYDFTLLRCAKLVSLSRWAY